MRCTFLCPIPISSEICKPDSSLSFPLQHSPFTKTPQPSCYGHYQPISRLRNHCQSPPSSWPPHNQSGQQRTSVRAQTHPIHWELESLMDLSEQWLHEATLVEGSSQLADAGPARILCNMQHSLSLLLPIWLKALSWQLDGLLYSNGFGNTPMPCSFQGTQSSAITYLWFEEFILLWSIWDTPKGGEVVIGDNRCLQMKPEMVSKLCSYLGSTNLLLGRTYAT